MVLSSKILGDKYRGISYSHQKDPMEGLHLVDFSKEG